jgi:hypothetical protein
MLKLSTLSLDEIALQSEIKNEDSETSSDERRCDPLR